MIQFGLGLIWVAAIISMAFVVVITLSQGLPQ